MRSPWVQWQPPTAPHPLSPDWYLALDDYAMQSLVSLSDMELGTLIRLAIFAIAGGDVSAFDPYPTPLDVGLTQTQLGWQFIVIPPPDSDWDIGM